MHQQICRSMADTRCSDPRYVPRLRPRRLAGRVPRRAGRSRGADMMRKTLAVAVVRRLARSSPSGLATPGGPAVHGRRRLLLRLRAGREPRRRLRERRLRHEERARRPAGPAVRGLRGPRSSPRTSASAHERPNYGPWYDDTGYRREPRNNSYWSRNYGPSGDSLLVAQDEPEQPEARPPCRSAPASAENGAPAIPGTPTPAACMDVMRTASSTTRCPRTWSRRCPAAARASSTARRSWPTGCRKGDGTGSGSQTTSGFHGTEVLPPHRHHDRLHRGARLPERRPLEPRLGPAVEGQPVPGRRGALAPRLDRRRLEARRSPVHALPFRELFAGARERPGARRRRRSATASA